MVSKSLRLGINSGKDCLRCFPIMSEFQAYKIIAHTQSQMFYLKIGSSKYDIYINI